MITHKRISLFEVPDESIIVHACNAKGVWGSGIAAEFKKRYPDSFKCYKEHCDDTRKVALGTGRLSRWHVTEPHYVGWIITSQGYAKDLDSKVSILANTALALDSLCKSIYTYMQLNDMQTVDVYSNKFNSGLFKVPWNESEVVLEQVLKHYTRINWVVCSND